MRVHGEQETGGLKPWLGHPGVQVGTRHVALFGVVGEGRLVGSKPGVLVLARHEGPQRHTLRQDNIGQDNIGLFCRRRGEPHLPQLAHSAVAVPCGKFRRGLVVAMGPRLEAGETAGVPEFAHQPVRHALVAVARVDSDLQHARAVRFLDDDRDARKVLGRRCRRGAGLFLRGVEGQGQQGIVTGVGGPERHEGLFGQRRVPVGFLRGGREGLDVPQQLFRHGSPGGEDGPVLRMRRAHGARLYVRPGSGADLKVPERGRIVVN